MKARLKTIADKLEAIRGYALVGWLAGYYPDSRGLVNLEGSHILCLALDHEGNPRLVRASGTLTKGDNGAKVLFASKGLVRIKSGKRKHLVVRPENLGYDEEGVPAGINKILVEGTAPEEFHHKDARVLDQVERVLSRTELALDKIPTPSVWRKTRNLDKITPRITGALVSRLRESGVWTPGVPVTELVKANIDKVAINSSGGWIFPFDTLESGGLTQLDLGSLMADLYMVPIQALDADGDSISIRLKETFGG